MMETPSNLDDLRDRFAAHALAGLLASYAGCDSEGNPVQLPADEITARRAYRYADAMIAQRAKPPAEAK